MSEYFKGVTFANQHLSPADDAVIRRRLIADGVLTGCEISHSRDTLSMAPGYLMACGRQIQHPSAEGWKVTYSPATSKTASGTVIALSDASDGPLQDLRIYGRTTQDGTPTPEAPVELVSVGDGGSVEVTICGKNLYDASLYPLVDNRAISSANGDVYATSSGKWCATVEYIPVPKSLIGKSIVKSDSATVCFYDNDKIFLRSFATGTYPFIVPENSAYYRFDMFAENKNTAQIALESTQTGYEPYTAQTLPISTPNGLPGIPVTSGGNYTDANGQQWICDEKDYSRGIYVKRVTKMMFDGSGNIVLNGNKQYPSTNVRFDLVRKDVLNIAKQYGTPQTILSNYSVAARNYNSTGVWINSKHDYFEGRISMPSSIASTVEEFSELLANTPIVFIVPLATPIETPIPEDELAAYAALHTIRPNTTVYNDAGAYMDVGYYPQDDAIPSNGYARILLTVDLTRTAAADMFDQVNTSIEYADAEDGFPALVQDDINSEGSVYQLPLAVVSIGDGTITGITDSIGNAEPI